MPGFFEGLKRMAQGKPVFDPNDSNDGWADKNGNAQQQTSGATPTEQPQVSGERGSPTGVVKGNASTFPQVYVKRTRTHVSGTNQDVYCSIINASKGAVELDE